jgi:hypothetical protein
MNAVVPAKFIFSQALARCLPRGRNGQRGSSSADGTGGDGPRVQLVATCFLPRAINARFGETIARPSLLAPREGEKAKPSAMIIAAG